jgi:release factor glutamine methyltransferase
LPSFKRIQDLQQHLADELTATYQDANEAAIVGRWLLEYRLKLTPAQILAYPDQTVTADQWEALQKDLKALKANWPPQYVIGEVDFLGYRLAVGPGVFIPRPETEELAHRLTKGSKPVGPVLDIGAGTGCLAISLAGAFPDLPIFALEASEDARQFLEQNIANCQVQVQVVKGDILNSDHLHFDQSFGLIVSNPPYVTHQEAASMDSRVTAHEPHKAFFVPDADPLLYYRAIANFASAYLCEDGQLTFEVNANYADDVASLLNGMEFTAVTVKKDLPGASRFVEAFKR